MTFPKIWVDDYLIRYEDYVKYCSHCGFCLESDAFELEDLFVNERKGKMVQVKCGTSNLHELAYLGTCGVERTQVVPKGIKRETVVRIGRPKTGRKTYPHSLSLTLEQIDYLRSFPNSSDMMRKILDALMKAGKEVEEKFPQILLKLEIDMIEAQLKKIVEEGDEWSEKLGRYDKVSEEVKERNKEIIQYYRKRLQLCADVYKELTQRRAHLRKMFMSQ